MQHSVRIPNGIVHYSTSDAIFRTLDGDPISMEFHHYCGPAFFDKQDNDIYPDIETKEGKHIWNQFDGWWEAKGKQIYRGDK